METGQCLAADRKVAQVRDRRWGAQAELPKEGATVGHVKPLRPEGPSPVRSLHPHTQSTWPQPPSGQFCLIKAQARLCPSTGSRLLAASFMAGPGPSNCPMCSPWALAKGVEPQHLSPPSPGISETRRQRSRQGPFSPVRASHQAVMGRFHTISQRMSLFLLGSLSPSWESALGLGFLCDSTAT